MIPKGVNFNKGVWTVSYKSIYLGCYLHIDDAKIVRRTFEQNCKGVQKEHLKDVFLAAVRQGKLPKSCKPGSSNTRHPRGISQRNKKK